MLVRFWGTRGSLPVAPTAATIRRKIAQALVAAGSLQFDNIAEAELFAEKELSFASWRLPTDPISYATWEAAFDRSGSIQFGGIPQATARPIISFSPISIGTTSWGFPFSPRPSIRL
jgi:hypothetical protein